MDLHQTIEDYAAQLEKDGIDPCHFISYVPQAVSAVTRDINEAASLAEDLAARLKHRYAEEWPDTWSELAFCVMPIGKACAGTPVGFRRCLDLLDEIQVTCIAHDIDTVGLLQHGVPASAQHEDISVTALTAALEAGLDLAKKGVAPQRFFEIGVSALLAVSGTDADIFDRILKSMYTFLLGLDDRGLTGHYPILCGVESMASVFRNDPEGFIAGLQDTGELCVELKQHEISPYAVLEHGVSASFKTARYCPELVPVIFPLALPMAAQGVDPHELLSLGLPSLASEHPDTRSRLVELAMQLAQDGMDSGPFLAYFAPCLSNADTDSGEGNYEAVLDEVRRLHISLHRGGFRNFMTFQYGLPAVYEGGIRSLTQFTEAVSLAIDIAEAGIDPGPVFEHGYAPAFASLTDPEIQLPSVLKAVQSLIAEGVNPLSLLKWAVPALSELTDAHMTLEQRLHRVCDLIISLEKRDADSSSLLACGIRDIARSAHKEARLFDLFLDNLEGFTDILQEHGIDPHYSLHHGLPRIAEAVRSVPDIMKEAIFFAEDVGRTGLDPGPLLTRGIPCLLTQFSDHTEIRSGLLTELTSVCRAFADSRLTPITPLDKVIEAIGSEKEISSDEYRAVFTLMRCMADEGLDATPAVCFGYPEACSLAGDDAERRTALLDCIAGFVRQIAESELDTARICTYVLPRILPYASNDVFAFVINTLQSLHRSGDLPEFDMFGVRAASIAAGGDAKIFKTFITDMATTFPEEQRQHHALALKHGSEDAAAVCAGNTAVFNRIMAQIRILAEKILTQTQLTEDGLGQIMCVVNAAAHEHAEEFERCLKEWIRVTASGAVSNGGVRIVGQIERMSGFIREQPYLWRDLLLPCISGHGERATRLLQFIEILRADIDSPDAVLLLKAIVTQKGVRATDIIEGLLHRGLYDSCISSLGDEKDMLLDFLERFPLASPECYRNYKEIMTDEDRDPDQRHEAVEKLSDQIADLGQAVVSGELSKEYIQNSLLSAVLFYVFPPSATVTRNTYMRMILAYGDHPEHVAAWEKRGGPGEEIIHIAAGSYQMRSGIEIDLTPWNFICESFKKNWSGGEDTYLTLGRDLFQIWIEGTLGKAHIRQEFLARIYYFYCRHHPPLPASLDHAENLLKYREFLSDAAREIILSGLNAYRAKEPERYARQAKNKVTPPAKIGKGLLRAIHRTVNTFRDRTIDRDTAKERLTRQLRNFDLTEMLDSILSSTPEDLDRVLKTLKPVEADVELGEEHDRVLSDLAGQELAAMERELYGDSTSPGKIEYRQSEGGASLPLRFQVTKRRCHAPIGYCEGVCTASDKQLWERPDFLQTVIWGPENRARGGMHLLILKEQGKLYLSLPGINPSLGLLNECGAEVVYNTMIAFAKILAERWKLAGVWIPADLYIASNRGPIKTVIRNKDYPVRDITKQPFSFSPYGYSIDRVFVIA